MSHESIPPWYEWLNGNEHLFVRWFDSIKVLFQETIVDMQNFSVN